MIQHPGSLLARENLLDEFAQKVLFHWLHFGDRLSPQDAFTDEHWEACFSRIGQFDVDYVGSLTDSPLPEFGVSAWNVKRSSGLWPTTALYRAAPTEHMSRWSWTTSYNVARRIADARGGGMQLWTCSPTEVFGRISFRRFEEDGSLEWTDWIVRPANIRPVSRWIDPEEIAANSEAWEARGRHAVEAASIVRSWFTGNPSAIAPMDRESGEFWLKQFQSLGQFHARYVAEAGKPVPTIRVEPEDNLTPESRLFRGSIPALKNRWSWTTSLEAARAFARLHGAEGGQVWTCEPAVVYGRIDAELQNEIAAEPNDSGLPSSFDEWIVEPKNVRRYEPI